MAKTRGTGTGDARGGKRGGKDGGLSGRCGKKASPARRTSKESSDDDDDDPPTKGRRKAAVTKKEAVSKKTASSSVNTNTGEDDDGGPATRLRDRTPTASPPKEDPPAKKSFSPKKNVRKPSARDVTKPKIRFDQLNKAMPLSKAPRRPASPSSRRPRKPAPHRVDDKGSVTKTKKRKTDSLTTEETKNIKNHQKALTNLIQRMTRDNGGNAWSDVIATLQSANDRLEEIRDGVDFVRAPVEKDGEDDVEEDEDEDEDRPTKNGKKQGGRRK